MSPSDEPPDDLRRRLFRELARGEEADLGPVLKELGLLVEPPAHLDAEILAAIPGAAGLSELPAHVERAVLAASQAAVAESRRKPLSFPSKRTVTVGAASALVLAAGLALVFGLRHLSNGGGAVAEEEAGSAHAELRQAVALFAARQDPTTAASAREAGEVGLGLPGWNERSRTVTRGTGWTPAEAELFAQALRAFVDRLRAGGQGRALVPDLEALLARERPLCPVDSRCHGWLSLRLGELALEQGHRDAAGRYAADAARTDDDEIRSLARALALKIGPGPSAP